MTDATRRKTAEIVLARTPKSLGGELGIDVARNTPSPLYQWLIASLLFSARISADLASSAAAALFDKDWRTPDKMAATSWEERVRVLNGSGYARYDESTARYIADTTDMLIDEYSGDLRKLREAAGNDPDGERQLLTRFKGIGTVGADIFFREVQSAWDELYPFADKRILANAEKLGLGDSAEDLAGLVDKPDFPRFLTGLVRADAKTRKAITSQLD